MSNYTPRKQSNATNETMVEAAVKNAVHSLSGEWSSVIFDAVNKMNNGFFDKDYIDYIVQKFVGRYDIYDAYCFAQIHTWIGMGIVGIVDVEVGDVPSRDRASSANNDKLQDLYPIFSAYFEGGQGDCDGSVTAVEPFLVEYVNRTEGTKRFDVVDSKTFPLEVGYTKAHTTLMHIKTARGVARWPYGHKWMRLFHIDRNQVSKIFFPDGRGVS